MKKKIFTIGLVILGGALNAQVSDSVAIGPGYANESYYSLADGEVANVPNNNWDLAFDVSNFGATIRANRLTSIYTYPGAISNWETLDTAGFSEWTRYYNSDVRWSAGALNAPASPDDATDLGWGTYNTTTHFTEGSRIFVVKLPSGEVRKLLIEELGSGTYTFKHDNLSNTDLAEQTIAKADYDEKNFIHYSMQDKAVVSREPNSSDWDLVFSNYHSEIIPDTYYGVSGVLVNKGTQTEQVNATPIAEATFDTFETDANIIGYDWKSFNFGTFSYDITDSLTYFVFTNSSDIWKLVFTGFGGSSNGKYYFTKELITSASIAEETSSVTISTYPNPTSTVLTIESSAIIEGINMYNTNGQMIYSTSREGVKLVQLDVADFVRGLYIIEITAKNGLKEVKKVLIAD